MNNAAENLRTLYEAGARISALNTVASTFGESSSFAPLTWHPEVWARPVSEYIQVQLELRLLADRQSEIVLRLLQQMQTLQEVYVCGEENRSPGPVEDGSSATLQILGLKRLRFLSLQHLGVRDDISPSILAHGSLSGIHLRNVDCSEAFLKRIISSSRINALLLGQMDRVEPAWLRDAVHVDKLALESMTVTDELIASLAALPRLTRLLLCDCNVQPELVNCLVAALPNAFITVI